MATTLYTGSEVLRAVGDICRQQAATPARQRQRLQDAMEEGLRLSHRVHGVERIWASLTFAGTRSAVEKRRTRAGRVPNPRARASSTGRLARHASIASKPATIGELLRHFNGWQFTLLTATAFGRAPAGVNGDGTASLMSERDSFTFRPDRRCWILRLCWSAHSVITTRGAAKLCELVSAHT